LTLKKQQSEPWQPPRHHLLPADTKYELEVFPGTHRGFCFPERAVYDTLAAEETWTKIFAMWDRNLR
jgi:hypothetical protein